MPIVKASLGKACAYYTVERDVAGRLPDAPPALVAMCALICESAEGYRASAGSKLPRSVKDESDAFLECVILAHGFPRLRSGGCGHDILLAFSCKRRGFCP